MDVLLDSVKNVSVIVVTAYPLTRYSVLQRALSMIPARNDRVILALIFGFLSVCGNWTTTEVFNRAILNSSIVGPVVGGVIAGPAVGVLAGMIGGFHRLMLGGFTAFPDGLAVAAGGLFGGLFYRKFGPDRMLFIYSFLAGVFASLFESILVLALAEPRILAVTFVRWTGLTSAVVNGIGAGIFTSVVHSVQRRQDSIGTSYAEKAMEIAQKTLPVIKGSLDVEIAQKVVDIIYSAASVSAVAITDGKTILAFRGEGSETHLPGGPDLALLKTFDEHKQAYLVLNTKKGIDCHVAACPHDAVIVAPLFFGHERIGFLHVYRVGDVIHPPDVKLVTGVANLLSLQLQNAHLERQAQLLARAEYAALRSQINPHFLFNTLSAIKLQVRENPAKAQNLILALASFFRRTLETNEDMITLSEELKSVEFYLTIQQARFGSRLQVEYKISPDCQSVLIPSFVIQPIVENCLNHGFSGNQGNLLIKIFGQYEHGLLTIRVEDNGSGIPEEVIQAVKKDIVTRKMGIGLTNVNRRLKSIYGQHGSLLLKNQHPGAVVEIVIHGEMMA